MSGDLDCHELFLMGINLTSGNDSLTRQYDLLNLLKQDDDDEEILKQFIHLRLLQEQMQKTHQDIMRRCQVQMHQSL